MRDGVRLAGEVYLPREDERHPSLVRKTPYDRKHPRNVDETRRLVEAGYAVAIVSFRGRFGSEGNFDEAHNEGWLNHRDGYDTIEWVASQDWSSGNVGSFGVSSDGQWQLSTAVAQPPHLAAMYVAYPSDWYGAILQDGVFTNTLMAWHSAQSAFARPLASLSDWETWLTEWERQELPFLASFAHPELVDFLLHPEYDDFWRDIDVSTQYSRIDVPVYHECGWYDRYVRWTLRNFVGILDAGGPRSRRNQRLLLGPWVHGGAVAPEVGPVRFADGDRYDRVANMLAWFDSTLRRLPEHSRTPRISLYLMGAQAWLGLKEWPPPETRWERYYLRSAPDGDSKQVSLNKGSLLADPASADELPDAYLHDPYNPIPTLGGHGGVGGQWPAGPQDHRPAEARSLTYETKRLQSPLAVVGSPRLRLVVSSSTAETHVVVTLTDVHPDGYSAVLRQNAKRIKTQGRPVEVELSLDAVANEFREGHRIRITVASSSFPAFLPNPGTGEPLILARRAVQAENAVYHDLARPSWIELPILPAEVVAVTRAG